MNPKEYRYTQQHEWIYAEPEDKVKMGITHYAQAQLGYIVFIHLPSLGIQIEQSQKIGEIESMKAVSELLSPVSGQVIEVNLAVLDNSQLVNNDPYGTGWLIRLKLSKLWEIDSLMNSEEYDKYITELT